jgi:type IV secretion system protein VirD4
MEVKKQLSSSEIFIRCLTIGVISGAILNQIMINWVTNKFFNVPYFDRFYSPVAAFRMSMFFLINNETYYTRIFGIGIGAGEWIVYATFFGGLTIAIFIALFCYRAFLKQNLYSARYGTAKWEDISTVVKSDKVDIPDSEISFRKHKRWGLFMGTVAHETGDLIKWINEDKSVKPVKLRELAHFSSQHIFVFAPTGSGKGVGIVIPTLVTYPSSVFVYDIKGENYISTSGWRHKAFGNIIFKFEPSCADGSSVRYNPMEEIRIGTIYEVADAQKLALALIDQNGKGLEDHWLRKGYELMTGAILHICYTKEARNLNGLTLFLNGVNPDSKENYANEKAWLSEMAGINHAFIHVNGYAKLKSITVLEAQNYLTKNGLIGEDGINVVIKASAAELINKEGKAEGERSSVISTATGPLSLYKDPIVAMNTAVSDFKLDDLQNFNRAVSFYFVVPNDQRERLNPLVRLLLSQTIDNIQSKQTGKKREITFVLDEFPELKKISNMESALSTIRGYKVRMLLIAQDYLQLTKYYGETQTIFSNCGIRISYAPNEIKTAEMLSKYTGITTFVAESTSTTSNHQPFQILQGSGSTTTNKQETSRPLMTADEITRLGDNMIILVEKRNPILGHKFAWYLSSKFKQRIFDVENPNNPGNTKYPPLKKSHRIIRKTKKEEGTY